MSCPGFGEVNIPSSRAFWDDCEEDEFENVGQAEKLLLKFDGESGPDVAALQSEILVVIEGPNVTHFASSVLLNGTKRICGIPAKTSSLHWNPTTKQLLAVLEDDLTSSGEVTELLLPYAKLAKKVLTITLKPKVDFKSEEIQKYSNDIAIVRGVGVNEKDTVELEAPNFIAGVAAGIASWRNHADLPVSSFAVYTDKLPLDSTTAQPVLKLLKAIGVSCSPSYVPARKESSYLYM